MLKRLIAVADYFTENSTANTVMYIGLALLSVVSIIVTLMYHWVVLTTDIAWWVNLFAIVSLIDTALLTLLSLFKLYKIAILFWGEKNRIRRAEEAAEQYKVDRAAVREAFETVVPNQELIDRQKPLTGKELRELSDNADAMIKKNEQDK